MNSLPDVRSKRILIADDEPFYLRTTGDLLRKAGFECECVSDAAAAMHALQQSRFDLMLSDLNMPGNLRLELLHHGRAKWPQTPVIVITGVPSLPSAIESLRLGIVDYLIKPVKYEDLLAAMRRALTGQRPVQDPAAASDLIRQVGVQELSVSGIIGESPCMKDLFSVLERVSSSDTNILITGESGTGKEVVAKSIHQRSSRSRYPFQIIDCTAIPEGLFESVLFGHAKGAFTGAIRDQRGLLSECHQGTAFFDEIGELPLVLQAKLLRTVQEQTFTPVGETALRSFDTRFVCATNRDLAMEVRLGKFRRDLFYRLAVVHIELPPLRDRGADVMLLAHYFLRQLQPSGMHVSEFSDEVEACFLKYAWPGNVRELRNVVERALAFARSSRILISDLPTSVRQSGADDESGFGTPKSAGRQSSLKDAERRHLISLLKANGGNVSKAAIEAGVSRQGMHKMLVRYGINASDFRS